MHGDYQLAYCPINQIISLAFSDEAFFNTALTPELIWRLRVPKRSQSLPLRWKPEKLDTPLLRRLEVPCAFQVRESMIAVACLRLLKTKKATRTNLRGKEVDNLRLEAFEMPPRITLLLQMDSMSRLMSQRFYRLEKETPRSHTWIPALPSPNRRRMVSRRLLLSRTPERGRSTLPYLSWNATVGRNSNFIDLSEEQRDELGGIEYRALKTLAVVLISYYVLFHLLGMICLLPWIMETNWGQVVTAAGQGRPWWAIFTAGSAFNDLGFTLTPDSMSSFQTAIFPLLLMTFLIIIGNTGFPCMLRLIIWVLSEVVSKETPLWEELKFLLTDGASRFCFPAMQLRGFWRLSFC
ncbi:hypothetical protein ASPSYDRAFT_715686 [Aspergillus sydowii CBS 593.65]|uniref:Cation transporter n=1 Tax=Aspergillus sydowii CBS 593.65 TaxID=1036612 RepID=A0A1L9SYB7_9EURO|nr:uncharacterized protein ASPSYDRAFT_715686 [Aspergillus sydowii CBS 593.65]OJJ52159.1 hypothetical protein ASPSYDRAFT_715686 [Aspergillus sydowii CBS 593.65]